MELDFEKYKSQQFCDNQQCSDYGQRGAGNIKTKSRKHHQVYCNQCQNSWVITKDSFFYQLKTPVKEVIAVLMLLSEGLGVNALCRVKGITADAIGPWLIKAAKHVNEITIYLERDRHLEQGPIDEFWSFILKKSPNSSRTKAVGRAGCSLDLCQCASRQRLHSHPAPWQTHPKNGQSVHWYNQSAE